MSKGPVESVPWPTKLEARRVSVEPSPRLDGYDIRRDLAPNYGPTGVMYCALTGALPENDALLEAFETVLTWLAPVTIAEAPAHAASLARLVRASPAAVLSTGAIAVAEQARDLVDRHEALFDWLEDPSGPTPACAAARTDQDRSDVATLAQQVARALPTNGHDVSLEAALLGLLHGLGIVGRERIEAAIVWARLPCVWSEALAVRPAAFRSYPMNTPRFEYEGSDDIE